MAFFEPNYDEGAAGTGQFEEGAIVQYDEDVDGIENDRGSCSSFDSAIYSVEEAKLLCQRN